jgi:hypothetical protein
MQTLGRTSHAGPFAFIPADLRASALALACLLRTLRNPQLVVAGAVLRGLPMQNQ